MPERQNPKIFVDDRELKSGVSRALFDKGALLLAKRLEVADFVASDRLAIERKTASDFEASIIDGRLFSQAKALNEAYQSPIIAIIGKNFSRVNPKAVQGALISIATDFKIPVFFFGSEEELGEFVYACAFREQFQEKRELKLNTEKHSRTLAEEQQFAIESLPQVGPVHAKKLLEHFGSIKSIANASEKELQAVEGIGKGKALAIKEILAAKYAH